MMDFSQSKIDIIGKSKLWYTISAVVIIAGLIAMGYRTITTGSPLKRGIDFAGGSIIQLQFDNWGTENPSAFAQEVRHLVDGYTDRESSVQTTIDGDILLLHIRADSSLLENTAGQGELYDDIRQASGKEFTVLEESEVGAIIGHELTMKAAQGVIVGLILILIYITIRLSLDFAIFAIVALLHDILVLAGVFAIFGLEINSPWVAILLTVVGYSINDTIIIYDRIRENMKVKRHLTFDKIVNQSLVETMARSINTSGTTIIAIIALLVFGGVSLRTFMTGLGVGIFVGTYSSIFVGSPLLVWWRLRKKGTLVLDDVETGGLTRKRAAVRYDEEPDIEDEEVEEEEEAEPLVATRTPVSKPKPSKKKRRRRY